MTPEQSQISVVVKVFKDYKIYCDYKVNISLELALKLHIVFFFFFFDADNTRLRPYCRGSLVEMPFFFVFNILIFCLVSLIIL